MRFTRNRDPRGRIDQLIGVGMFGVQSAEEEAEVPFDPSQLSTPPTTWLEVLPSRVFSDSAGTVPANASDEVKVLGASGSTTRTANDDAGGITDLPIYYVDESGRSWLQITSTTDRLKLSTGITLSLPCTIWFVLRHVQGGSDSQGYVLMSDDDGGGNFNWVKNRLNYSQCSLGSALAFGGYDSQVSVPPMTVCRMRFIVGGVWVSLDNGDQNLATDPDGMAATFTKLFADPGFDGNPNGTLFRALIVVPADISDSASWNNMDAYLRRIP